MICNEIKIVDLTARWEIEMDEPLIVKLRGSIPFNHASSSDERPDVEITYDHLSQDWILLAEAESLDVTEVLSLISIVSTLYMENLSSASYTNVRIEYGFKDRVLRILAQIMVKGIKMLVEYEQNQIQTKCTVSPDPPNQPIAEAAIGGTISWMN